MHTENRQASAIDELEVLVHGDGFAEAFDLQQLALHHGLTRRVAPPTPPEELRVQAQPAAPAPREAQGGTIKNTLDKIMAASDGQISERLRAVISSNSSTAASKMPATSRRSKASMPAAITHRSGSATANSPRAPRT